MRFVKNIHLVVNLKPQVLITRFLKAAKDYGLSVIDVNEEERSLRLIIPIKMYPLVPELIEEYCSYSEFQIFSKAKHNMSATKLRKIHKELKLVSNYVCWFIEPPNSYPRILGVMLTDYGSVYTEIYPARSRAKGAVTLKYISSKLILHTIHYTTISSSYTFIAYKGRNEYYYTIDNAIRSLSICEKVLKKAFTESK